MPESPFDALRCQLIDRGVSGRYAVRSSRELHDHFNDLKAELENEGVSPDQAAAQAFAMLGSLDALAESISRRPELKSWAYRYPWLGRTVLPLAYFAMVPVGWAASTASYATALARWGAISALSATITAAMFLAIQKSIMLG